MQPTVSMSREAREAYRGGHACYERGDWDGALVRFQLLLESHPRFADVHYMVGLLHERRGELEEASRSRGKLANLQASLGDAYREAGDLREAIDAYRKALDRCPGFHDIRHRLGVALREIGLPSRAVAEFQRVLRGNPAYLDSAVQLGLTWYTLGRTRQALDAWEQVLARDPEREDARMYLRMVRASQEPRPARQAKPVPEATTLSIDDLES